MSQTYPIKPGDIDEKRYFFDAFDHAETETSACWLIRLARQRGEGWEPFSHDDIQAFYAKTFPKSAFGFNHLIDKGWIVKRSDGEAGDAMYSFTHQFVARCFRSSPAKKFEGELS